MRSQCDTAPSRAGPNASAPRDDGSGLRVVVDHDLEGAEMALGGFDGALHHREFGDARRPQILWARDQHGDIEMIGEQLAGFDRGFVAAVDQDDALAVEADEGDFGRRLGGGRVQRRQLRPGGRARSPAQDGALFRHSGSGFEGRMHAPRSSRHALGYNDPNLKAPFRSRHADRIHA